MLDVYYQIQSKTHIPIGSVLLTRKLGWPKRKEKYMYLKKTKDGMRTSFEAFDDLNGVFYMAASPFEGRQFKFPWFFHGDMGASMKTATHPQSTNTNTKPALIIEKIKPWMAHVSGKATTGYAGDYGLQRLWDEGIRGQGVKVGVNDQGFVLGHADFDYGRIDGSSREVFIRGRTDQYSHGTSVAGIIGARANGLGVVGVANQCNLWIQLNYAAPSFVMTAADAGCDVVNNSWGPDSLFLLMSLAGQAKADDDLDAASYGRKGLGMSLVFAAGSTRTEGWNTAVQCTTNHENVITVAEVDINTKVAEMSTPGETVHVAALGENVYVANAVDLTGELISVTSGSSFAAPFVSGAVALM